MIEMLKRRHIAPIYGDKTPLAPEKRDYMAIRNIPDVFVTGHVHTTAIAEYHGVRLINASTWQSQTSYQKMRAIVPDPAKAVLLDLQNLGARELAFT